MTTRIRVDRTVGVLPAVGKRGVEVEVEVGTIINKEEVEMIADK